MIEVWKECRILFFNRIREEGLVFTEENPLTQNSPQLNVILKNLETELETIKEKVISHLCKLGIQEMQNLT